MDILYNRSTTLDKGPSKSGLIKASQNLFVLGHCCMNCSGEIVLTSVSELGYEKPYGGHAYGHENDYRWEIL